MTDINGKARLTVEGTVHFKSFKDDKLKREEFFSNLTVDLAKAIPVNTERIIINGKYELDTLVSSDQPEQYILSINIKGAKDERSAKLIAEDLNTLIKYKLITTIGSGTSSNYLDHEYGYETIRKYKNSHFFFSEREFYFKDKTFL